MMGRQAMPSLILSLPPDLDRDLLHAQRDRWLRLGRLHPHALQLVVAEQTIRHHTAQPLERLVRALLGDQRDELANLRIVDRVLERIGRGGIRLADVQPQVEHESLANLALGVANPVVGVQRQSRDLDRDRLGASLDILVAVLVQLVLVVLLILVIVIARVLG